MPAPTLPAHRRWRAVCRIQRRDLQAMLRGRGVYVVLSLSLLTSTLFLQNYLNFVQEQGLLVTSGALNAPLYAMIFLASLFLTLSVITMVGHEQAVGMIADLHGETADAFSYVVGKHLAQVSAYLVMGIIYGCGLVIWAGLANFSVSLDLIWIGLVSVLITAQVVALAIFLAVIYKGQTARNLFLSIVLILMVIQFGPEILANISPPGVYAHLSLSLQNSLASLSWIVTWISPYGHLSRGIEAVKMGSQAAYLTTLLSAALQTSLFIGFSIVSLERREG
jgi:hypothetical protein